MNIQGSPDISVLQLQVTFDISGLLPVINVKNLSTGPNLGNITWWFVVTSPSGTPIHEGSFSSPDAVGAWSTLSLTDQWPMPFSQIEWSGAPYNLTVYAQDSAGNIYNDSSYSATIARPNGSTSLSKNFYGLATTNVLVKCQEARIYFEDTTSTSYRGISGTQLSAVLRVIYPLDPTYSIPPPFVAPFTSPILVPISYSSKNYQFVSQSVYNYQLSTYVFVNVQYQQISFFDVLCNIDLGPLVCEFTSLIDSVQNGSCSDVNEATRKIILISPKMSLAFLGIFQPLTGVDVAQTVQDIIEIGGFSCDCCNASTGIIPNTASVIDGYSFSVNTVCGDIAGTVTVNGSNIQFNLQDKSYVFNLSQAIPTTAFSITPSMNGCVKTYTLNVSMVQFATDLANTILGNSSLVNIWNNILQPNGGNFLFTGDGKCVYTSTATFNYTFTLLGIPSSSTFAQITGITNGSLAQSLNFQLNLTNLTQFQTYLNTLGLGTFAVTNPSGQTVLITSNANPNKLSNLTYSISSTNFIANFTSVASGYVPIPVNQIIQAIINYLCGLTDEEVVTSQAYTITYIDQNGKVQTQVVAAGTPLSEFISMLLDANSETLANVGAVTSVSCESITAQFGQSNNPIGGSDYVLGTKGGVCSQVAYLDAFKFMLTSGILDAATKQLFCNFVISCGAGLQCAPYDFFEVLVTNYSTSCSEIVGIEVTLS